MTGRPTDPEAIMAALAAPFPVADVEWRVDGKPREGEKRARCVCYIDARAVQGRLDAVLEPFAWSAEYVALQGGHVECRLTLEVAGRTVTRADVGEPNQGGFADALKSAYSDALKRAAVHFGIGRYLYEIPAQYAEVRASGSTWVITDRGLAELRSYYAARCKVAREGAQAAPERTQEPPESAQEPPESAQEPRGAVLRPSSVEQAREVRASAPAGAKPDVAPFWRWTRSMGWTVTAVKAAAPKPIERMDADELAAYRRLLKESGGPVAVVAQGGSARGAA
ncbi:MAG TPA: Rad52/Rad22 family DNA repair protein [Burkholderiales bacterium]|nr:Rad52/Rad22 family DNA repair protein [Burkholderiales bacterium]